MTVHITLSGSKADRFREIKDGLRRDLGYVPSNPEVVGFLMSTVDDDKLTSQSAYRSKL